MFTELRSQCRLECECVYRSNVGSSYSGSVNDSGLAPSTTYFYYIFSVAGYSGPNNSSPVKISVTTTAAPVATPDPLITSFLVGGQTTATVNSGSSVGLTFSGTNVASYKLFLQCPANVAIPDASGNNLCRSGESDALPFPPTGSIQITPFNMSSGDRAVNATLFCSKGKRLILPLDNSYNYRPTPASVLVRQGSTLPSSLPPNLSGTQGGLVFSPVSKNTPLGVFLLCEKVWNIISTYE